MKKLLTIFGAVGLLSSISSNAVSCGKSDGWFSLPAYPTNDDDMKALGVKLDSEIEKYSAAAKDDWAKANPGNDKPTDDFIKGNDNAQKSLVENYNLDALGYILGVMKNDEDAKLQYGTDADGNPSDIYALSKDKFEDMINTGLPTYINDSYKSYFTKIMNWAEDYKA